MAFSDITALLNYINTNLTSNGADAITGDQLNTALVGIVQFLSTGTGGTGTVTDVTAGRGLDGGTITTSGTIDMELIGTGGTYGDGTHVPRLTTDAVGRVTGVTNVPITSGGGGTFDIGNIVLNISGTTIPTTFTVVSGLSYTPRYAILIPKSLYASQSFMIHIAKYAYIANGFTIQMTTTTSTIGVADMDWITFQ